jgi:hypothetical protein
MSLLAALAALAQVSMAFPQTSPGAKFLYVYSDTETDVTCTNQVGVAGTTDAGINTVCASNIPNISSFKPVGCKMEITTWANSDCTGDVTSQFMLEDFQCKPNIGVSYLIRSAVGQCISDS